MCRAMDKNHRDELIMKYAPLVKTIVLRMASRLPIDEADKEDLFNVGILGLMSALEKYDERRNVQFETYARFRIKGAVLDELRARDWLPRSTRNKDSRLEEALRELERELGRPPEEEEIARFLGISLADYHALLDEVKSVTLLSQEDLPQEYLENQRAALDLEQGDPLRNLLGQELVAGLKKALDTLPKKERLVLNLYYYEELTMKEIGQILELTESRVCQIHAQAILRLKSMMRHLR